MIQPPHRPTYELWCYLAFGACGAVALVLFALDGAGVGGDWIANAALGLAAICGVGIAAVSVHARSDVRASGFADQLDRHNREIITLRMDHDERARSHNTNLVQTRHYMERLDGRVAGLDDRVREAVEEQTSDLSAAVAELQATRTQMADFMKLYEPPALIDLAQLKEVVAAAVAHAVDELLLDLASSHPDVVDLETVRVIRQAQRHNLPERETP